MNQSILLDHDSIEQDEDDYKTPHEALSAKLHQMADIANVTIRGQPSERELYHILWGLTDLLQLACAQCDELRPGDLMSEAQLADRACKDS